MADNNFSNEPDYRYDFKSLFMNQGPIKAFIEELRTQTDHSEIDDEALEKKINTFCDINRSIRSIGILAGKNIRERNFYTNLYTDSDDMKLFIRFLIDALTENDQIFHALKTVFSPYFKNRNFSTEQLIKEFKKIFPEMIEVDEKRFDTTQTCYVITSNKLTHLKLPLRNQTIIPEKIFLCEHLIVLDLSSSSLKEIPKSISKLKRIKQLNLDYNNLYQLPDEICQLEQLTELSVTNNVLANLPRNIGHLSQLQQLFLNSNRLNSLPDSMQHLKNLTELTLNNNQLETFPTDIGKLYSIISLEAANNKLETLPESFYNLSTLISLSLYSNALASVSDNISQLNSLETLDLRDNQILYLPDAICELNHLKKLYLSGNRLSELPQKINQLRNLEDLSCSDNQIEIIPKSLAELSQLEILQIENNPLKNIPPDMVFSGKDAIFKHLVSNGNNQKKNNNDNCLPYADIRHSIKDRKRSSQYIPFTEFKHICINLGMKEEQIQQLIGELHAEGSIYHFLEDSVLKNWVVINPQWVDQEEKKLLKNNISIKNQGYLDTNDLNAIWKNYSSEQQSIILRVMFNLGICFQKDAHYIVPQLLPLSPPSTENAFEDSSTIQIEYHYQNIFRNIASVVTQLIVRTHDWCDQFWRYGMIVVHENARAMIRRGENYRTIVIITRDSPHYKTLQKNIQNEIDSVHQQLKISNVRAYVPCCCSVCRSDNYKFYYYYNKLVEQQTNGISYVYCGYSLEKVDIDNLL